MLPSDLWGLPPEMLLVLAAAVLLLPTLLAFMLAQQAQPRARLRSRLSAIAGNDQAALASKPTLDRAKRVKTKLRESGHAGNGRAVELRLRLERAGLSTSNRNFYLVSVLLALIGAALYMLLGFKPIASPA